MTRTAKTRLGCEVLEVRECPAVLAMDSPDLRRDPAATRPPASDTGVLVDSTPAVTLGPSAKGIIVHF